MLSVALGLMSALLALTVFILNGIRDDIKELNNNIKEINRLTYKNTADIKVLEMEVKSLNSRLI